MIPEAVRRNTLILEALKEARDAIPLSAPIRTLAKVDRAIALMEPKDDCDGIDVAKEVYGETTT